MSPSPWCVPGPSVQQSCAMSPAGIGDVCFPHVTRSINIRRVSRYREHHPGQPDGLCSAASKVTRDGQSRARNVTQACGEEAEPPAPLPPSGLMCRASRCWCHPRIRATRTSCVPEFAEDNEDVAGVFPSSQHCAHACVDTHNPLLSMCLYAVVQQLAVLPHQSTCKGWLQAWCAVLGL